MKFKCQRNPIFFYLSWVLCLSYFPYILISNVMMNVITGSLIMLLLVMMNREFYLIEGTMLYITRGLSRFTVNIMDIDSINIAHFGSRNGIEIMSRTSKITVFPVDLEQFVRYLLTINPDIFIENGAHHLEGLLGERELEV